MDIREAVATTELAAAAALFVEYAPAIGDSRTYQRFDEEVAALPGRYGRPSGRLYVAWDGAGAVGCVALREIEVDGERVCEMKRMYVRPRARGTGLGRRLGERAIADGREMGYRVMKLDTDAAMMAARGLYGSLGFVECRRYNDDPMETTVFMELVLGDERRGV